jgi:hypothetical protein
MDSEVSESYSKDPEIRHTFKGASCPHAKKGQAMMIAIETHRITDPPVG